MQEESKKEQRESTIKRKYKIYGRVGPNTSVITINENELNSPTKR